MKAITLTPPWGTLVAVGAKRIETRSWPTNYRGPIAIHQAKGLNGLRTPGVWEPKWVLDKRLADLCDSEPFFTALRPHLSGYTAAERAADLPRGTIVAIARLAYCLPTDEVRYDLEVDSLSAIDGKLELAFGDYSDGRYAWRLERVLNLYDGIECRGGLGLWDVPADVLDQLLAFDDIDDVLEQ